MCDWWKSLRRRKCTCFQQTTTTTTTTTSTARVFKKTWTIKYYGTGCALFKVLIFANPFFFKPLANTHTHTHILGKAKREMGWPISEIGCQIAEALFILEGHLLSVWTWSGKKKKRNKKMGGWISRPSAKTWPVSVLCTYRVRFFSSFFFFRRLQCCCCRRCRYW